MPKMKTAERRPLYTPSPPGVQFWSHRLTGLDVPRDQLMSAIEWAGASKRRCFTGFAIMSAQTGNVEEFVGTRYPNEGYGGVGIAGPAECFDNLKRIALKLGVDNQPAGSRDLTLKFPGVRVALGVFEGYEKAGKWLVDHINATMPVETLSVRGAEAILHRPHMPLYTEEIAVVEGARATLPLIYQAAFLAREERMHVEHPDHNVVYVAQAVRQ